MTATPRKALPKRGKQPGRGIALTVWLTLLGALAVIGFLSAFVSDLPAISLLTAVILAIFVYGLWKWMRWAYYGVLLAFSLVIVVTLLGRSIPGLTVSVLVLLLTIVIVQPRIGDFR